MNKFDLTACMVCLSVTDLENTKKITRNGSTYHEQILYCVPEIEWTNESNFELYICKICSRKIEEFTNFKLLCIQSNVARQKYVREARSGKQRQEDQYEGCINFDHSLALAQTAPSTQVNFEVKSINNGAGAEVSVGIKKNCTLNTINPDEVLVVADIGSKNEIHLEPCNLSDFAFEINNFELNPSIDRTLSQQLYNIDLHIRDSNENLHQGHEQNCRDVVEKSPCINGSSESGRKQTINPEDFLNIDLNVYSHSSDKNEDTRKQPGPGENKDNASVADSSNFNESPKDPSNQSIPNESLNPVLLGKSLKAPAPAPAPDDLLFKCNDCLKEYRNKNKLVQHLKSHSGKERFLCDICGVTSSSKANLLHHKERHKSDLRYECTECSKRYKTSSSLNYHKLSRHQEKQFSCQCGYRCTTGSELKIHKKRHRKELMHHCPICNKGFVCKYEIKRHLQTHSGKGKHQCFYCKVFFDDYRVLKRHLKGHEEKKETSNNLECVICKVREFTSEAALEEHMKNHEQNGQIVFNESVQVNDLKKCLFCKKSYSSQNNLINHMPSHGKIATLQCRLCFKQFPFLAMFNTHLSMQHGYKLKQNKISDYYILNLNDEDV